MPAEEEYKHRATVRLYRFERVVRRSPTGQVTGHTYRRVEIGARAVRYAVEIHPRRLRELVNRAAYNLSGRATAGPMTVYLHPDDRSTTEEAST